MSLLTQAAPLCAIVMIGLLAGVMLGVAMVQETAQGLDGASWIIRQNLNDRLFRKVMPPVFALNMVSTVTGSIVLHGSARLWMEAAAFTSLLVIVITVALEIPLNNRMSKWEPKNLPEDWMVSRDAWLRNPWSRTWCGLASFICSLIAFAFLCL